MKNLFFVLFILSVVIFFSCGPRYYSPVYPTNDPYSRQFQKEVKNILEENIHTEEIRARNDARVGIYQPPTPGSWNYNYLFPAYDYAWKKEQIKLQREARRKYERWAEQRAIEDARRFYSVPPPPPPPSN